MSLKFAPFDLRLTLTASAMLVAPLAAGFAAAKGSEPAAVAAYVERRLGCNHWLGEDGYDRDRAAEIEAAVKSLRCATIDRDERVLRRRYAGSPAALAAIDRARDADQ